MNFLRLFQTPNENKPLGGRYRIVDLLGSGGFGQTFLAEDLHLPGQPRCVIKQLKPQVTDPTTLQTARRLFDTEAQVLYKLGSHDQIPRLLAHFEENQEFYLAQELVEGEPLTHEMTGQPWPEGAVLGLLRDILQVLAFVHQQNVIHRDIKPSNLMRRQRDRRVVLIDFGAVKQASTVLINPDTGPTQTISIGTQGYMPNEQLGGNPRFSSDVYAVGIIGIQALTGIPPRLLHEDPKTCEIQWRDRARTVSPALADVLDRMVRYDFRARYPSAAEALAAIMEIPLPEGALDWDPSAEPATFANPSATYPIPDSDAPTATAPTTPAQALGGPTPQPLPATLSRSPSQPFAPSASRSITAASSSRLKPVPIAAGVAALGVLFLVMRAFTSSPPLEQPQDPASPTEPATSEQTPETDTQVAELLTEANQLREAEQYQQALETYDQAIALDASKPEALWGRCYSLNYLEQLEEAIAACDQALNLNPNYAEALWSKGFALDQQKKHEQALTLYDQAIALKPDFAEAWSNKGTALLLLGRSQDAVAAFDRATQLDPTLAEAWNNRGAALWSLRRFDEAVNSIDRALQIDPDYVDAVKLRQEMRNRLGK